MRQHLRMAVTFATRDAVQDEVGDDLPVRSDYEIETDDFLFDRAGRDVPRIKGVDARRMAVDMLRRGWEAFAAERGLLRHEMSGKTAWYFRAGLLPNDWGTYPGPEGRSGGRRKMSGVRGVRRIRWHYALSAKPQILPVPRLILNGHLVFAELSGALVTDDRAALRYRKALCRNWWNDAWRDRLRVAAAFLANGEDGFDLPLGGTVARVAAESMRWTSPVGYAVSGEEVEVSVEDGDDEREGDGFDEALEGEDDDAGNEDAGT